MTAPDLELSERLEARRLVQQALDCDHVLPGGIAIAKLAFRAGAAARAVPSREPTWAMIDAAHEADSGAPMSFTDKYARIWRAMYDAAPERAAREEL